MAVSFQITGATIGFSGGQITSVNIAHTPAAEAGVSGNLVFTWQLTPAEQAASAAFVTQLTNKLAAISGAVVTTS